MIGVSVLMDLKGNIAAHEEDGAAYFLVPFKENLFIGFGGGIELIKAVLVKDGSSNVFSYHNRLKKWDLDSAWAPLVDSLIYVKTYAFTDNLMDTISSSLRRGIDAEPKGVCYVHAPLVYFDEIKTLVRTKEIVADDVELVHWLETV